MRFLDLVFLRGAGCPGNPCYGGQARTGHTVDQIRKKMPILFQIENFQLFYYSTETAEIFANESTHEYIHFLGLGRA